MPKSPSLKSPSLKSPSLKSPSLKSDLPEIEGAAAQTPDEASSPPASQRVRELPPPPKTGEVPIRQQDESASSQRVRELPPPPKSSHEPRLPEVEVDRTRPGWWRRLLARRMPSSCAVSFVFHFLLLVGLGLLVERSISEGSPGELTAWFDEPASLDSSAGEQTTADPIVLPPSPSEGDAPRIDQRIAVPKIVSVERQPADKTDSRRATSGFRPTDPVDWLMQTDAAVGGSLAGRRGDARSALAKIGGGTDQSERAVERGLRWLMAHQCDDGSWNFDHNKSICRGQCGNPGSEASTTAATAIALLSFLGAGYTHREGEYQEQIKRGLYYLGSRALLTQRGTDLQEGTMYAQGLAAIALCEAYAMTGDTALRPLAQGAIDFIVSAQDQRGGGWRYGPGEPGDTTVTGWQLMGLKSGQMANLTVPSPTIFMVQRFLSSVQRDGGSQYGYMDSSPRNSTTAIGLLCRMYTGWRQNHPGLQRGVVYLSNWGPSEDDIYYDYYATQVLHHWGGPLWEEWNEKMRDYLIGAQAATSHEAGSWFFPKDRGAAKGGRIYCTAMAVMTLEVYYRYLPLYGSRSVEGEF